MLHIVPARSSLAEALTTEHVKQWKTSADSEVCNVILSLLYLLHLHCLLGHYNQIIHI